METIIFYRETRGIGDAVMLLRTIELYKRRYPNSKVVVVMDRPASAVFEQHPAIDEITTEVDITKYNNARFFNVSSPCLQYEGQKSCKRKEVIDKSRFEIFAEHCNIQFDGIPGKIHITDLEYQLIHDKVFSRYREFYRNKLIGITLKSAQEWRSYPTELTEILITLVNKKKGYITIVIDPEYQNEHIFSTCDLDIREAITLISQLDLVIGPDTGPLHIAGSLEIPTLWIFGPTDPELRAKYYKNAEWIWEPCKKRDTKACWYNYCLSGDCLYISPWKIFRKARQMLK